MSREFSVDQLIPHAGRMILLDRLVAYNDESISTEVVIYEDSQFYEKGGVPAWVGIEYMAQTVSAYVGMQRALKNLEPRVGFLVGARKYLSSVSTFSLGKRLLISAQPSFQAENGLGVFECRIKGDGIEIEANLNVFEPESVEEFMSEGE